MSTLREMISSVREYYNAYSDDTTLSNEHLAFSIHNERATYLEALASNVRKGIPAEAFQTITLSLEAQQDCEDDMVILSSKEVLPEVINCDSIIEGIAKVYLPSVAAKWINIIGLERFPFIVSGGRFNSKQIYITRDSDNKLLLFCSANTHLFLNEIKIDILASNPEEAGELTDVEYDEDGDVICDFYDKQYPLSRSLNKAIIGEVAKALTMKYQTGKDVNNNGADDSINKKVPYYGPRRQQQQQQKEPESE